MTKSFTKDDYFFVFTTLPKTIITARHAESSPTMRKDGHRHRHGHGHGQDNGHSQDQGPHKPPAVLDSQTYQMYRAVEPQGITNDIVHRASQSTVTVVEILEDSLWIKVDNHPVTLLRLTGNEASRDDLLRSIVEEKEIHQQRELSRLRADFEALWKLLSPRHEIAFDLRLKSFSPSYACIPFSRGQSYPNWVWAFYVYGNNSSPNQAGQLQVCGFLQGSSTDQQLSVCYSSLELDQQYHIRWYYSQAGSQLWVDNQLVGTSAFQGPLDVYRAPKGAVTTNPDPYEGGGRPHTKLNGSVTNYSTFETE